jgi:hypothetical protein
MLEAGASSTLFPVGIELVFHRNTSCHIGVSRWDSLCLLQIGIFSWDEETHVSFVRKPRTLAGGASSVLFFGQKWVCFWKKDCLPIRFSKVRKAHFVPRRTIQLSWRSTCISQKKIIKLEAGACSTLCPCQNWISFWKEYCLPIRDLKGEKRSFSSKQAYSTEL